VSSAKLLRAIVQNTMVHPSPLPNRAAALGRFAYRQLHKRVTSRTLVFDWEGMELGVPPEGASAGAAFYFGRDDWWEMSFIEHYLRPGDLALDIGANVGVYSLYLAKQVGPTGRVLACEADATSARHLRDNVARNYQAQVDVIEAAIGEREGTVRFLGGLDCTSHISSADEGGTPVPMTTLDALVPEGRPMFVKVDVEGAEERVLMGATQLLRERPPLVWQLELLKRLDRTQNLAVMRILLAHGYRVYTYRPSTRTLLSWRASGRRGRNVLAILDPDAVRIRLHQTGQS